jgi:hypothetical protein
MQNAGVVWDYATLDDYLADTKRRAEAGNGFCRHPRCGVARRRGSFLSRLNDTPPPPP